MVVSFRFLDLFTRETRGNYLIGGACFLKWVEKNHHLAYWFSLYFPGCIFLSCFVGRQVVQISHLCWWFSHHVDLDETLPAGSVLYIRDYTTCTTHFYWEFDFMLFFSGFLWTHLRYDENGETSSFTVFRNTCGAQPSSSRRESTWIKKHRCRHLLSWFEV